MLVQQEKEPSPTRNISGHLFEPCVFIKCLDLNHILNREYKAFECDLIFVLDHNHDLSYISLEENEPGGGGSRSDDVARIRGTGYQR